MPRLLLLVTLLALTFTAQAQERPRIVSVTGSATLHVVPDQAEVNFVVHTFDRELPKSKQLNDEQGRKVLQFIKSLGVEDKDIQTDSIYATADYEEIVRDGYRRQGELKGYTTRRSYSVTLKDVSKFAALTDSLLVNTAISLSSYDLQNSEAKKHRDEARRKAVAAAKEKAALLAGELGCTLGATREISETRMWSLNGGGGGGGGQGLFGNADEARADGPPEDSPTRLGEIAISANVDVVFDLIP